MSSYKKYPPKEKTPEQKKQLELAFNLGIKAAKLGLPSTHQISEFYQMYNFQFKVDKSLLLTRYIFGHHSISAHLTSEKAMKKVSVALDGFHVDITFELQYGDCFSNECASVTILDAIAVIYNQDSSKDIRPASDMPETNSIEKLGTLVWENEKDWVDVKPQEKKDNEAIERHFKAVSDDLQRLKKEIMNLHMEKVQNPISLRAGIEAEIQKRNALLAKVQANFQLALNEYNSIK